jgi:hypothetical protein
MSAVRIDGFVDFEEIGRGGFGVVYRARQESLGRAVAIKVLPDVVAGSDGFGRFERECRALGSVDSHPNIATVHGSGITADNRGYLAMELLEGGSLAERIREGGLPWEEVAEIGVALAGALESAHRAGVLHRDVKPQNIMFDRLGTPKLLDFGVATVNGSFQTRSAAVTMTLAHAAPEIVGGAKATVASDVYALGSSLFAALAGHAPFVREDEESLVPLLARIASAPAPDLRERGVPDSVAELLESALAKDPGSRPASAEAFGVGLAAVLAAAGKSVAGPAVLAADGVAAAGVASGVETTAARVVTVPSTVDTGASLRRLWSGPRRRAALSIAASVVIVLVGGTAYAMTNSSDGPVPAALTQPAVPTMGLPSGASTAVPRTAKPSPPASGAPRTAPGGAPPLAAPGTGGAPAVVPVPAGGGPAVPTHTIPAPRPSPALRAPGVPGAGSARYVSGTTNTSVRVSVFWGRASGTVSRYEIRGGTSTSTTSTSATLSVSPNNSASGYYTWQVRAVNAAGASAWRTLSAAVLNWVGRDCTQAAQMIRTVGLQTWYYAEQAPPTKADEWMTKAQSPTGGTFTPGGHVSLTCYGAYS